MSQKICSPADASQHLVTLAKILTAKGWLPATSGNLSVLLERDPLKVAVTASGVDKEFLSSDDILIVDSDCRVLDAAAGKKPSFETQIHLEIYRRTSAGCVLHVHTIFNNLAAELADEKGNLTLSGIELIKALGIWEEDASIHVPVVDNFADIGKLTEHIAKRFDNSEVNVPCVLIRAHGIYAWGANWLEAKKHLQAFEFMFEYVVRSGGRLPKPVSP